MSSSFSVYMCIFAPFLATQGHITLGLHLHLHFHRFVFANRFSYQSCRDDLAFLSHDLVPSVDQAGAIVSLHGVKSPLTDNINLQTAVSKKSFES